MTNHTPFDQWKIFKTQESEMIQLFKEAFPMPWENNIGNDCAILQLPEKDSSLLVTQDLLVEGRHFFSSMPAEALAYKALAVNMSDIFSDGGIPTSVMLGLSLPSHRMDYCLDLAKHLIQWAKKFEMPIIGGDTVASDTLIISVTCFGKSKQPWLRKNAKIGDYIYLSGPIGGSAEGLKRLQQNHHFDFSDPWIHQHCFPPIKKELTQYLVQESLPIHAAVDVSDGFLEDLTQILLESGVSAKIDLDFIPLVKGVTLRDALVGGEDYEIIFTSSQKIEIPPCKRVECSLYLIGQIVNPSSFAGEIIASNSIQQDILDRTRKKFFHFSAFC